MRRTYRLALLAAIATPAAVSAAALSITKTATVVSDGVNPLNPRALPGAEVDYTLTVDNPNTLLNPVGTVQIVDDLPADVVLCVDGYGAGASPVEFADGSLLGTGLLSSGLSLSYRGLADGSDGVDFFDGTSWNYTPVSTGGYDARVRAIRVKLSGTQASGSRFRLRFRVKLQ